MLNGNADTCDQQAGIGLLKSFGNILMVEDDKLWRRVLDRSISSFADISWVSTMGDAIYELSHYPYNAFIADLNLPDSCPHETIAMLKNIAANTPTVVITGDPGKVDAVMSQVPELCGAISKPEYDARWLRLWMERDFVKMDFRRGTQSHASNPALNYS